MTPGAWLVCCLCVHRHDTSGTVCVLLTCALTWRLWHGLCVAYVCSSYQAKPDVNLAWGWAWLTCKCSSNSRLARNTSWVRCCTCLLYSSSCFCSRINASSFKRDNCSSTVLCCCSNSLIRVCKMLICRLWSASPSSRFLWINQQCQVSSVQDGIYSLRKAHTCSSPSLRNFSRVESETIPMLVRPTMALSTNDQTLRPRNILPVLPMLTLICFKSYVW